MRSYRRFLLAFSDELQMAIAEAENLEWHHEPAQSAEWQHYNRLVTWETEITERMVFYAAAKARSAWKRLQRVPPTGASARSVLGGHPHRQELGSGQ